MEGESCSIFQPVSAKHKQCCCKATKDKTEKLKSPRKELESYQNAVKIKLSAPDHLEKFIALKYIITICTGGMLAS